MSSWDVDNKAIGGTCSDQYLLQSSPVQSSPVQSSPVQARPVEIAYAGASKTRAQILRRLGDFVERPKTVETRRFGVNTSQRTSLRRYYPLSRLLAHAGYGAKVASAASNRSAAFAGSFTALAASRLTGAPTTTAATIPMPRWGVHLMP